MLHTAVHQVVQLSVKNNIHSTYSCLFIHASTLACPHACSSARLNRNLSTQESYRVHARTMASYKARLLYITIFIKQNKLICRLGYMAKLTTESAVVRQSISV